MLYNSYEKNGKVFYEYSFDGLYDLIEFIKAKEPIELWKSNGKYRSLDENFMIRGTKSMEEAIDLCINSNSKNIDDYVRLSGELEKDFPKLSNNRSFNYNYYGSRVNVPRASKGNPKSMEQLIRKKPLKLITIWVNTAFAVSTNKEAIQNRGIVISSLIHLLESSGYRVSLNLFSLSECKNEVIYIKTSIKRPGERLDLSSSYFPLCHPSFDKRLMLAVRERTNVYNKYEWNATAGRSVDSISDYLDVDEANDIAVPQPKVIEVEGNDIYTDTVMFFEKLNICDYIFPGKKLVVYEDESNDKTLRFIDDEEKIEKGLNVK